MRKINTILFDVDGTLLDTEELIFRSVENTLKAQDYPISSRDVIRPFIGKPLREIYRALTGKSDVEIFYDTHHTVQSNNLHLSKPFPNAYETLVKLKENSYKIGAITSRRKSTTSKTLENANLLQFIDFAVYADDVTNHKPHPEAFLKALSALESTADESLMIGDSEADILGGKNLNLQTVGALYGMQGEKIAESNPDFLIKDISELLPILAMA